MSHHHISPATLAEWLTDGEELAVIDVREREVVGYASPLFATNLPAAEVPGSLARFVPRRSVRTVLIDDGSGVADELAEKLEIDGWTQVVAVEGGIPAWLASGEDLPTFDTPGVDFVEAIKD
jgi:rhodanese-related sulfurtransferase